MNTQPPPDSCPTDDAPRARDLSPADRDYLKTLLDCEHQAIDAYDKVVLALSGGSFAISFAFLKDVLKGQIHDTHFLIWAWVSWGASLALNLAAFYFGHLAMRAAQLNYRGWRDGRINKLTGPWHTAVVVMNPFAGSGFIVGLICMSIFVTKNLGYENKPIGTTGTTSTSTKAAGAETASTAATAATTNTNTPAVAGSIASAGNSGPTVVAGAGATSTNSP